MAQASLQQVSLRLFRLLCDGLCYDEEVEEVEEVSGISLDDVSFASCVVSSFCVKSNSCRMADSGCASFLYNLVPILRARFPSLVTLYR